VALREADTGVQWETGLLTMYTNFPAERHLERFENAAERQVCAMQFLTLQMRKVHQDMKEEGKKAHEAAQAAAAAAAAAIAKHAKDPTVAVTPATTTALSTRRTRRTPRNPMAPTAPVTPRTRRDP